MGKKQVFWETTFKKNSKKGDKIFSIRFVLLIFYYFYYTIIFNIKLNLINLLNLKKFQKNLWKQENLEI